MNYSSASKTIVYWLQSLLKKRKSFPNANNDIDAFDLDPIGNSKYRICIYDYQAECKYTFNAYNLLKYFVATAKFENPYTRKKFCNLNLLRIYKKYVCNTASSDYIVIESENPNEVVILNNNVNFLLMTERLKNIVKQTLEDETLADFLFEQVNKIINNCFEYCLQDEIFSSEFCFMLSIMYTQERCLLFRNYTTQLMTLNTQNSQKEYITLIIQEKKNKTLEALYGNEEDEENYIHKNILVFIEEILLKELTLAYLGY